MILMSLETDGIVEGYLKNMAEIERITAQEKAKEGSE